MILFRYKKQKTFQLFIQDIISKLRILNLPQSEYELLAQLSSKINLDFDDLYQYAIAKYYNLQIVTMDSDFKKIKDLKVKFI